MVRSFLETYLICICIPYSMYVIIVGYILHRISGYLAGYDVFSVFVIIVGYLGPYRILHDYSWVHRILLVCLSLVMM